MTDTVSFITSNKNPNLILSHNHHFHCISRQDKIFKLRIQKLREHTRCKALRDIRAQREAARLTITYDQLEERIKNCNKYARINTAPLQPSLSTIAQSKA